MTDTLAPLPPAILLMGPTASGKTALALALARHIPVEIISVDSALVYRGMDIGAAKPSAAEQAQVPHHLIDIIDPPHAYSAAQFTQDARQLMAEITARGRVPLLAGGTMLYFKALQDGLSDLPAANPAVRAELDQLAAERGWPALHAELARIDPATAARLAPNDAQRIQRALELCRMQQIDGVVYFCQWGCKQTMGAAQLFKSALEAEGYPVLLLDGDGCDRANTMDGQTATRLDAFLEMLHSKQEALV